MTQKKSLLNRYRNKCNWIFLSELVLSATQRLSADWNQGLILVHHHQLFDGYRMNTTAVNYHQTSGNTLGLQQQVTRVLSVTLLCCCWLSATACVTQRNKDTAVEHGPQTRGIHSPAVRWTGQAEPAKLKPEPGGYGHVQRGKQKTKHMYWPCSKRQLQFKSSSSTNRLQGPHL